MNVFVRGLITAAAAVCCIQIVSVAVLAPRMNRSVAAFPSASGHPEIVQQTMAMHFELENVDGDVLISAHDSDRFVAQADYRIYTHEWGQSDDARAYADTLFELIEEEDRIVLRTEPIERPDGMDVFADYKIFVPRGADIEVNNANGNIQIDAGLNEIDVRARNADIKVMGADGTVVARTVNGRIDVYDANAGADVLTVNGDVAAYVNSGELAAQTTNGSIVARLLNANVETCDLTTRNGGITVVMNEDCSAALEARTARGAVKSDWPVDASTGIERRRHVRGVIGAGQTALTMDSLNGNIWITRSR